MAATSDGRILGLRCTVWAGMGAYLSTAAPGIPTILHGLMLSGPYKVPAVKEDVYGVYTNTTPVEAYRGAGRPEATLHARAHARQAVGQLKSIRSRSATGIFCRRSKNGTPWSPASPTTAATTRLALDKALEHINYKELRAEQARLRKQGRYLGIGVCTYVEICGLGPSQVAGAVGFQGGLWESAIVRFHPSGKVNVFIGASPHGQGEETTFAQIVAERNRRGRQRREGHSRRHRQHADGLGHLRQPHDGRRRRRAGDRGHAKIKDKAKLLAAHLLEAAAEDIEYEDGRFFVKGAPIALEDDPGHRADGQRRMEPARRAWKPGSRRRASTIRRISSIRSARTSRSSKSIGRPGSVDLKRYVAVDDCGPQINPMIVEGQVHGGVVQGIGQALWEGAVYDEGGQLVTGSLLDYAIPRADVLPEIDVLSTVTQSPHHPLGVKGIGEAGTIASTAAVYNAVIDALEPFGVDNLTCRSRRNACGARCSAEEEHRACIPADIRLSTGPRRSARRRSSAAASRREGAAPAATA